MALVVTLAFVMIPVGAIAAIAAIVLFVRFLQSRSRAKPAAEHPRTRPLVSTPVLALLVILGAVSTLGLYVVGSALAGL